MSWAGGGTFALEPVDVPDVGRLAVVVDAEGAVSLEPARAKAESLGARVLAPLVEVPGIGRYALVADPSGAPFSLFEPAQTMGRPMGACRGPLSSRAGARCSSRRSSRARS